MGRSAIPLPQPAAPSRCRVIQEGLVAWSADKSMRCQNCSAENPKGAKFCIQCATPFRRLCEKCGFENPPEARFCAQCAASLTGDQVGQPSKVAGPAASGIRVTLDNPEPQALEGERRTVTALFADIKGSTELMRDLGPEFIGEQNQRLQNPCDKHWKQPPLRESRVQSIQRKRRDRLSPLFAPNILTLPRTR